MKLSALAYIIQFNWKRLIRAWNGLNNYIMISVAYMSKGGAESRQTQICIWKLKSSLFVCARALFACLIVVCALKCVCFLYGELGWFFVSEFRV